MAFSASANTSSDYMTGRNQPATVFDSSTVAQRFAINLTTADLASGVVGAVGILPAGNVPVAFEIDAAAIDSGAALAYSVGILNAGQTAISTATADGGAAWATAQSIGKGSAGASGIVPSRPLKLVTQTQTDRMVGIAITTAAGTAVAGQFAITLWYRPSA